MVPPAKGCPNLSMFHKSDPMARPPLELWGGVECSCVRVGDVYRDQLSLNGHRQRLQDLDAFAAMGIRKLRMPLLWEHIWPDANQPPDWRWADAAMARLQALGIEPIVGLLHHGSGPTDTHLLDTALPERLAAFAYQVAKRYPWVRYYTPVNEPLTTARFAGLYGLWYPHHRTDGSFVRALLTQVQAVRAAMAAVRSVNPFAGLVQTDDLGYTQSTPRLSYQATFENERRWLSYDLLCGLVRPGHSLYRYLRRYGATVQELAAMAERPCKPAVLGINHYITSERYLDGRTDKYPAHTHGGNGVHRYADVETCRSPVPRLGPAALLSQAWERYGLPIAITEAHLGCTRDEQMRWLYQMWTTCQTLRRQGVDVRGCTAWALLGSFDWDSLLTQARGHYEAGVFDLTPDGIQPTEVSALLADLAAGREVPAAVRQPGWWDLLQTEALRRRPEQQAIEAIAA